MILICKENFLFFFFIFVIVLFLFIFEYFINLMCSRKGFILICLKIM